MVMRVKHDKPKIENLANEQGIVLNNDIAIIIPCEILILYINTQQFHLLQLLAIMTADT